MIYAIDVYLRRDCDEVDLMILVILGILVKGHHSTTTSIMYMETMMILVDKEIEKVNSGEIEEEIEKGLVQIR